MAEDLVVSCNLDHIGLLFDANVFGDGASRTEDASLEAAVSAVRVITILNTAI